MNSKLEEVGLISKNKILIDNISTNKEENLNENLSIIKIINNPLQIKKVL